MFFPENELTNYLSKISTTFETNTAEAGLLFAAIELNLFNCFSEAPLSLEQVAKKLGVSSLAKPVMHAPGDQDEDLYYVSNIKPNEIKNKFSVPRRTKIVNVALNYSIEDTIQNIDLSPDSSVSSNNPKYSIFFEPGILN